jgi:hypothetical protein
MPLSYAAENGHEHEAAVKLLADKGRRCELWTYVCGGEWTCSGSEAIVGEGRQCLLQI